MGEIATGIGGGGCNLGVKGRVGEDMVEGERPQGGRRMAEVAVMHPEREAVLGGVPPGELGVVGLELEAVQVEPLDTTGEAEGGHPGAAAELEDALAPAGGNEGGEKHRIGGGAVAGPGLPDADAAVQEGVVGEVRGCEAHSATRPSTSLSLSTERARKKSRSATMTRRGRMPMEPSRTLMWTSRTKQSISSPRSNAVLKAMTVGSLVRRSSRMARRLETATAEVESHAPNPLEQLQAALAGDMERVNALIRVRMASEHAPRIPEVTAHLVEAGGKRLRPLLTLAAARLCGYEGEHHLRLAATVEFIHTATLLHDDVVDESAKRRGRPTANLLWDNKSSVLVGDYLFARAFQLMVETGELRVLDILANASAVIAEGEVLQLTAASNLGTGEATYLQVVRGKTAALFAAATEVGGVIAGGPGGAGAGAGHLRRRAGDRLPDRRRSARLWRGEREPGQEHRRRLPRAEDDAAGDPGAAGGRAGGAGLLGPGDRAGRPARGGPGRGAGADGGGTGQLETTLETARAEAGRAKTALAALPDGEMRAMLEELADFVVARIS